MSFNRELVIDQAGLVESAFA